MISHIEAQALISARMDGPLDPIAERELQAHIATCPACRAFADQTSVMARAFHNLPYLPSSPTVSRAVLQHVQRPRTLWGRGQEWLAPNLGSAFATLAALVVIVALGAFVLTRVIGSGGDGDPNIRVLTAPSQESSDGVALNGQTPTSTPGGAVQPTDTIVPTDVATLQPASTSTDAVEPTIPEPTSTAVPPPNSPTTPPGRDQGGNSRQDADKTEVSTTAVTQGVTPVRPTEESQAGSRVPTDGATQAAALQRGGRPTPTDEPTIEPTSTEVPTIEPTSTEVPTIEPISTDEPTIEPSSTEVPTVELTATPLPTWTPIATATATPLPTQEPTPTDVPTVELTATPEPTSTEVPTIAPTSTLEPTATPAPTQVPPPSVTAEPSSTVNDQIIEPSTGIVEGEGGPPTSIVVDLPTAEVPSLPPPTQTQSAVTNETPGDATNQQVIEPSTQDAASPLAEQGADTSPTAEAGGQGPATDVPAAPDSGAVIVPADETPTGTGDSSAPTSGSIPADGDLAGAAVLGPFPGGPGDRLVDQGGTPGGAAVPDAAGAQSAGGATLAEQPAADDGGTSVAVCLGGTCVDATSASATGPHQDAAIGWVNGTTLIYQRTQDGAVDYRAAEVDAAATATNDRSLGSGGAELERAGSVFAFGDGLLVETNGGWVVAGSDGIVWHAAGETAAPRTLVRVDAARAEVAYVSGGELVVQDLGSDTSVRLPFGGVDYALSPGGDRVVVSTGTTIEIVGLDGQVEATWPNAEGMAIGSVLWLPGDTIVFVDQTTGQIRSISAP